jgi:cytosine deaminase
VPELRDAGITIGFGSDCVMDPWYSLGKADMLDVAFMGLHVGHMSSRADMRWCYEAVTANSAKLMGLEKYGLEVGNHANFVILQAKDTIEAIRLRANRLAVVRHGAIIAKTTPQITTINLPDRPSTVQSDTYAPRSPSER